MKTATTVAIQICTMYTSFCTSLLPCCDCEYMPTQSHRYLWLCADPYGDWRAEYQVATSGRLFRVVFVVFVCYRVRVRFKSRFIKERFQQSVEPALAVVFLSYRLGIVCSVQFHNS